ncbi:uncharacterized protein [Musca autumnalis]|uniref:uncharacterized protein n=1 Tax=Musca autumnalis TaxID=221902 RepID=UPI003CEF6629
MDIQNLNKKTKNQKTQKPQDEPLTDVGVDALAPSVFTLTGATSSLSLTITNMDIGNDSPNVTASSSKSATKRTENMGGDDTPELDHINDSLKRQSLVLLNLIEESVPLTLKEESIPDEIWEKLSLTEEEEDMDTTVIHVPTSSRANNHPSGDALVSDNPDKPLLLRQKAVEEESGASEEHIDGRFAESTHLQLCQSKGSKRQKIIQKGN